MQNFTPIEFQQARDFSKNSMPRLSFYNKISNRWVKAFCT